MSNPELTREAKRHRDLATQKQKRIEALANDIAVLQAEVEIHVNAANALEPVQGQGARVLPMIRATK